MVVGVDLRSLLHGQFGNVLATKILKVSWHTVLATITLGSFWLLTADTLRTLSESVNSPFTEIRQEILGALGGVHRQGFEP